MSETRANWTIVAEYTNRPLADLAANLLEEHGIPTYLWSDDGGGLLVANTYVDRVRLFVPDDELERARDIVREAEADRP
jgi:hypothetical protein